MKALDQWKHLFDAFGIAHEKIKSNANAVTLTGLAGAPVFRAVDTQAQLSELHTKARQKSEEMGRLLVLGLPLTHRAASLSLPGGIVLPACRAYGGNVGATFSLSGHKIEPDFLVQLKKEVLAVMSNGTGVKTPLLDWLQKLAGNSWPYGTPAGLTQLDSLLGLVARDTKLIGHVRTRQLSFGRGCGDAMLLPIESVVLKNNNLNQHVASADMRFISLEAEMGFEKAARQRIHAQFTDKYLSVLNEIDAQISIEMGCEQQLGASVLGKLKVGVDAAKPVTKQKVAVNPSEAMASV